MSKQPKLLIKRKPQSYFLYGTVFADYLNRNFFVVVVFFFKCFQNSGVATLLPLRLVSQCATQPQTRHNALSNRATHCWCWCDYWFCEQAQDLTKPWAQEHRGFILHLQSFVRPHGKGSSKCNYRVFGLFFQTNTDLLDGVSHALVFSFPQLLGLLISCNVKPGCFC